MTAPWIWIEPFFGDGIAQMSLDEALLEWVRQAPGPVLIARTYVWNVPTLSLGVHQSAKDTLAALKHFSPKSEVDMVRRPTGGRAILHGQDMSFAFITNDPQLLSMSLSDSYCHFSTWVRQALLACGVPLQASCETDGAAYTRSAICFETQTPSDLLATDGRKVAGSAQLRRQGGILQHGAAFLQPFEVSGLAFAEALLQTITATNGTPRDVWEMTSGDTPIQGLWETLQVVYAADAAKTRAKLATTSGSHLAPDSAFSTSTASAVDMGSGR